MFTSTLSFHLPVSVGPVLSPNLSLISYLVNVCVCMLICVQGVCRYICSCMQGHLEFRGWLKPLELFLTCCLHHVCWNGVCHWLRVYQVGKAGWTASPRDPPICASPGQEDKCVPPQIWLCVCVLETDLRSSCLHSGASLTEPSQLPSRLSFKCKFCIS